MTPQALEDAIDAAIGKLLRLSEGIEARDENSKPAITPKELTEALKIAVEYWQLRRPSPEGEWGKALTGKPPNGVASGR